jgi:hypothetical protein
VRRRIDPDAPVVAALGVDDERPDKVFRLKRRRARDDQVLLTLCDLGACGNQVERWRLAHVDSRAVVALELLGEVQRSLLDVDRRQRRHQRPVAGFRVGSDLRAALPDLDVGNIAIAMLDLDLRPRGVGLEVAQQRLREDRLQRRGQRRREALERVVGGRAL